MPTQEQILYPGFAPGFCDFCGMDETRPPQITLVFTDPETGCLYCLPCLAAATDPANQLEELPPTEADVQMAREAVAAHRTKDQLKQNNKQGNTNHARN